jgi:hypothetical protein
VAWPISELLGRQTALVLSGVPALAGWLMITYSTLATTSSVFLGLLYVGRVLTGFSTGWAVFCVSVSPIVTLYYLVDDITAIVILYDSQCILYNTFRSI